MQNNTVENMKWVADSMLDNFPGCIMRVVYTDEKMWMEYVSGGVERIFEETPEEYKAKINRLAMGHVASDDAAWGKVFVEEAYRTGKGLRKEYAISRKNGERHWIEIRSSVEERTEERIVIQYVILDIDEQKRAEEQAKKRTRAAGSSGRSFYRLCL